MAGKRYNAELSTGWHTCPAPSWPQLQQPKGWTRSPRCLRGWRESELPACPRHKPLGRHLNTVGSPAGGKTSPWPRRAQNEQNRDSTKKAKEKKSKVKKVPEHGRSEATELFLYAALNLSFSSCCKSLGCDQINYWAPTDVSAPRSRADLSDTMWSWCFDWHSAWAAGSSSRAHVHQALAARALSCLSIVC